LTGRPLVLRDKPDCGGNCELDPQDLINITAAARQWHKQRGQQATDVVDPFAYEESSSEHTEWQVDFARVHVRRAKDFTADIVGDRLKGEVVFGEQQGDWIKLAHEPAFMAIHGDGLTFLRKRTVSYKKLASGTCEDALMYPILTAQACESAAFALGYFVSKVENDSLADGCYFLRGDFFLAAATSAKNGSLSVCASQIYPTTTTTTTTTTMTITITTTTSNTSTSTMSTTTTTTWGNPSLFCFEVMMTTTYEFGLVKKQIEAGAGIFTCDEHAVFSQNGRKFLAKGPNGPPVYTIWFEKAPVWKSQDNTAANTLLFMHLWQAVKKDGRYAHHDWTVKADPDAVVLPWRIRSHLAKATGPNNYLVNCNKYPGTKNFPMIYGAFEAYSRQAMQSYFNGGDARCASELPWRPWGEDFFMHHCMKLLGVQQYDDFSVLADKRCMGSNCGDGIAGAYHDFKSEDSWFQCWKQAVR